MRQKKKKKSVAEIISVICFLIAMVGILIFIYLKLLKWEK